MAAKSKATSTNPKDLFGALKVSVTKIPPTALLHCATAMMEGARKYGAYNWRDKEVLASIYVDAALRHLLQWWEGKETDPESGHHHLGHAMACMAILVDAQETGNLVDDRPGGAADTFESMLSEMGSLITEAARRRGESE